MRGTFKFLVVDFHAESRFLLVKTLVRKFPDAEIVEEDDADRALALARGGELSAIVTHRTFEIEGIELVRQFRAANHRVPIIMVSGIDREAPALAAGADSFLPYDEWLRIGTLVETHLEKRSGASHPERDFAA